jgi:hypothetical protein
MKKETIINVLCVIAVITIGLITLSVAIDVQQKAIEECIKIYGNCSAALNTNL